MPSGSITVAVGPDELTAAPDTRDWQLCSTPDALAELMTRLDIVVTTRLHGLVLALRVGVPALAIDPVWPEAGKSRLRLRPGAGRRC